MLVSVDCWGLGKIVKCERNTSSLSWGWFKCYLHWLILGSPVWQSLKTVCQNNKNSKQSCTYIWSEMCATLISCQRQVNPAHIIPQLQVHASPSLNRKWNPWKLYPHNALVNWNLVLLESQFYPENNVRSSKSLKLLKPQCCCPVSTG